MPDMDKALGVIALIVGVAFVMLAALYWLTPAGMLPTYLPGYEMGSATIHFKHGLGSLIVGLALFFFAWFKTAPKSTGSGTTQ